MNVLDDYSKEGHFEDTTPSFLTQRTQPRTLLLNLREGKAVHGGLRCGKRGRGEREGCDGKTDGEKAKVVDHKNHCVGVCNLELPRQLNTLDIYDAERDAKD